MRGSIATFVDSRPIAAFEAASCGRCVCRRPVIPPPRGAGMTLRDCVNSPLLECGDRVNQVELLAVPSSSKRAPAAYGHRGPLGATMAGHCNVFHGTPWPFIGQASHSRTGPPNTSTAAYSTRRIQTPRRRFAVALGDRESTGTATSSNGDSHPPTKGQAHRPRQSR